MKNYGKVMKVKFSYWLNALNKPSECGDLAYRQDLFTRGLLYSYGAILGGYLLIQISSKSLEDITLGILIASWLLLKGVFFMVSRLWTLLFPSPDIDDYAADINYRLERIEEILENGLES